MRYNIEIVAEDPTLAGAVLHQLSNLVGMGATHSMGQLGDGEAIYNLNTSENVFDDGDYQDGEGNLIHVHDDAVVNVTWAGTAKQEDFEDGIDVDEWHEKHGHIRAVG